MTNQKIDEVTILAFLVAVALVAFVLLVFRIPLGGLL